MDEDTGQTDAGQVLTSRPLPVLCVGKTKQMAVDGSLFVSLAVDSLQYPH